ncbi:hypothetical protein JNW91_08245 [Micromonospora sp. STR1_7]|uniref:Uncharacterized protein n=1 Tax=Micromonospora parastrephiae TaxID=2806101 RepID=A0ABS1XRF9_9ACTN|nr:hypothetical protein [Micromonospora parastrephiae]MBM0231846.1 hypothetical protein [Micromonospora parastrephiae]
MTDPELHDAVVEETAEQDVPGFLKKRDLCRGLLLSGCGVYHVAHYTTGVLDFALDLFAHPSAPPSEDEADPSQRREAYRRVGAQLVYRVSELHRRLGELHTGALIRTVVQTRTGLVFCNSVVGNEHVVGFGAVAGADAEPVADPSRVSVVDRAAAQLATDLRRLLRQRSQNPGGWEADTDGEPTPAPTSGEEFRPYVTGSPSPDGTLTAALRPQGLHYLSHHRMGDQEWAVDILDHPDLDPFFNRGVTVVDRRDRYQRLAGDLSLLALQVGRDLRRAVAGNVTRLVLDVEMGAVFYYRLSPDDYLVGVTLSQDSVARADQEMATVARRLTRGLNCREDSRGSRLRWLAGADILTSDQRGSTRRLGGRDRTGEISGRGRRRPGRADRGLGRRRGRARTSAHVPPARLGAAGGGPGREHPGHQPRRRSRPPGHPAAGRHPRRGRQGRAHRRGDGAGLPRSRVPGPRRGRRPDRPARGGRDEPPRPHLRPGALHPVHLGVLRRSDHRAADRLRLRVRSGSQRR